MTAFQKEEPLNLTNGLDLVTFGQRLRHLRKVHGYTLSDLGERVGRAPSQLSLLENGRREPKLSLLQGLATALEVPIVYRGDTVAALWLGGTASSELEVELERAAAMLAPYCLVGWDTGGEEWVP